MKSEILRAYNGSDDYMLETANTLHNLFVTNVADFTAFDTNLDAAFGTTWLASIDAAGTVVRDSQIKDILAQKTDEVLAQMDLCILKYNEVKYFATKVFPKNRAKQAEFGTDTYDAARRSQSKMIPFMEEMHKACLKYQAELVAGGYTAPEIGEILALRIALLDANTQQESYLKGRPVLTQERVETLSIAFGYMRTVIDAAKVIYYNDYARRNMYVFYEGGGSGNGGNDTEIVNAVITNLVGQFLATVAYAPTRNFRLTNNGPASVDFYLSDDPSQITVLVTLASGETVTHPASSLGNAGNNLFAKLTDGTFGNATIEVEYDLNVV